MNISTRFVPRDRQESLASGRALPERDEGAVLFADISGFTPLTEELSARYGPLQAAEEMTRHLDAALDPLITLVHSYGGAITGFVGDAITAWFSGDNGHRATACALAQQAARPASGAGLLPGGAHLTLKAAVATGPVHRFLVGDPALHQIEVLAGATLNRVAAAEQQARPGEVILDPLTAAALGPTLRVADRRGGAGWAVIEGLNDPPPTTPPAQFADLDAATARPWLLPEIAARLAAGPEAMLAELRPVVSLFLQFGGLDYDADPTAPAQLDAFIRWIQHTLAPHRACILALAIGDKGSFLHTAFGAPAAHEDDAQRAVAVALALRTPPAECPALAPPRLGLTKGRVWSGVYGGTQRGTYDIMGPPVNLACRLMERAQPGQVLLSADLAGEVRGAFRVRAVETARLKGVPGPVALYEAEAPAEAQPEPAPRGPLVGRAAEMAQLGEHLQAVRGGHGRVVAVSGEAGIGKSRLVDETVNAAQRAGYTVYRGAAQATTENTPYSAWRQIWWKLFDLRPNAPAAEHLARLTARVAEIDPDRAEYTPLLAAVLDLPLALPPRLAALDDKQRKETRDSLLADCLKGIVLRGERPALLVLEDTHWLDPLSRGLLKIVGEAAGGLPLLLLLTSRQPGDSADAAIQLGPLAEDEVATLIAGRLAARRPLPGAAVQHIAARTSGNPLFVEELLAHLAEQGVDATDAAALRDVDVPPTLQRLVLSRLDQLPEAQKTVLKVASVLGQQFQPAWLAGYYPPVGAAASVAAAMEALCRHEMVVDDGPGYRFRHSLIQEAVYASLTQALRTDLHGRFAGWLEHEPGATPGWLDLLAYHYGRSADTAKQREYFRKAGDAAVAAYANAAAAAYYERLLPLLPADDQAPILIAAGETWVRIGSWEQAATRFGGALPTPAAAQGMGIVRQKQGQWDEAVRYFELAQAGYIERDDLAGQGRILAELGNLYRLRGNYPRALELLRESAALASTVGDLKTQAIAINYQGNVYSFLREHKRAYALYTEALQLRRAVDDRTGISAILNNLGLAAFELIDIEGALAYHRESLKIKRDLGDRSGIANALNNLGLVSWRLEQHDEARDYFEQSLAIKRDLGDRPGGANTVTNLALVCYSDGDFNNAWAWATEGVELCRSLGDRAGEVRALGVQALVLDALGDQAAARRVMRDSMLLCRAIKADMITEVLLNWSMNLVSPSLATRLLGLHGADETGEKAERCAPYIKRIHNRARSWTQETLGLTMYQSQYEAGHQLDFAAALDAVLAELEADFALQES